MCQAVFGHYFPCGESCNLYIPTAGLSGSRRADNENVKRRKLRIDMDSTPALESDRLKVEQMIVDGQKQLEAIFETHRQKMALLYSRRFDLPPIRKVAQQANTSMENGIIARERSLQQ